MLIYIFLIQYIFLLFYARPTYIFHLQMSIEVEVVYFYFLAIVGVAWWKSSQI